MKVLMVGGAGYVGTILRPAFEQAHDCFYYDLQPVADALDRSTVADVCDDGAIEAAVAGVDAVLYLAMGKGASGTCQDTDPAFQVNVNGLYRFLDKALSAGVRRFVYASTLSVYGKLGRTEPLDERIPPDAWTGYGITKRLGEYVCAAAVDHFPEATIVALRLNAPRNERDWPPVVFRPDKPRNSCALGPNDTRRLFLAAVQCTRPGCHVVQASGDLLGRHFPNDRVQELLDWFPRGD